MNHAGVSNADDSGVLRQDSRGHGEDAIYFDAAKNRYVGAISLGFGPDGKRDRRKVTGRTMQEVRDKPKVLHAELDRGLRSRERSGSPRRTIS